MRSRSIDILTIGGFDPSNGAGITADVKTFEALGRPAISVQTCLTIQNESDISKVYWSTEEQVREQLDVLFELHQPKYIKLSLTKDLVSALGIVQYVLEQLPDARIIWDPVMVSSSGFDFYDQIDRSALTEILRSVYLTTPNWEEIGRWREGDPVETASRYSSLCFICLKGGHRPEKRGVDTLFRNGKAVQEYMPGKRVFYSKHGSGCVFASALTACLSNGGDVKEAVQKAKHYIETFLDSDPGLLGRHIRVQPSQDSSDRLYYLTQDLDHTSHREQARIAIRSGVAYIQVRSKTLDVEDLTDVVAGIVSDARGTNARIIVNDHVEVAARSGAHGVHLGNHDMSVENARAILGPGKLIGGTANTFEDIRRLVLAGVDYIGLGPYRFTETKEKLSPVLGIDGVRRIAMDMKASGIQVPVYVIGGVTGKDVRSILHSGLRGIAVSSAVNRSEYPERMIWTLLESIGAYERHERHEIISIT